MPSDFMKFINLPLFFRYLHMCEKFRLIIMNIRNIWKLFSCNRSNVRFYLNKFRGKKSWMHFKRKIRVRQYSSPYKTYEWQWKPGKCNVNLMSVASYYVKYILKWTWIVYTHILFFHELTNVMYFNLTVMALTSLL